MDSERRASRHLGLLPLREKDARHPCPCSYNSTENRSLSTAGNPSEDSSDRAASSDEYSRPLRTLTRHTTLVIDPLSRLRVVRSQVALEWVSRPIGQDKHIEVYRDRS